MRWHGDGVEADRAAALKWYRRGVFADGVGAIFWTASGKVLDAVQHALDGFYIEAIMTTEGPFAITIHLTTLQWRGHPCHIRRPWILPPHTFKPFCLGCLR